MITKFKEILKAVRSANENLLYSKEILNGQIFTSTIENSAWLKNKSFSPGGWAVDYGVLYTLYRILNDVKPINIVEFGLGQSSKMIHQYSHHYAECTAETIEHDENWIRFFKNGLLGEYPVNISIHELKKTTYKGHETLGYKDIVHHFAGKKFNLIVVDGPFGYPRYSRHQIIDMVPQNLDSSFCIIIDDYNRPGEKDTFREVCDVLSANKIEYATRIYSAIKEHAVICSADLKFLTTL